MRARESMVSFSHAGAGGRVPASPIIHFKGLWVTFEAHRRLPVATPPLPVPRTRSIVCKGMAATQSGNIYEVAG